MSKGDVFLKAKDKKIVGYPIQTLYRGKAVSGQFGIEIECEGTNLFRFDGPGEAGIWAGHRDGSLRDRPESMELVLCKPLNFKPATAALDLLFNEFKKGGTVLNNSNRTSMHVHVNVQKWYMNRLASFCTLWFIYEDLLSHYCGENRVGNLFCLRGIDAEAIVTAFIQTIKDQNLKYFGGDNIKYSALNGGALLKQGSLEIRTMRGPTSFKEAFNWLAIIDKFVTKSERFADNPNVICEEISLQGPNSFLLDIVGQEVYEEIIDRVRWGEEQLSMSAFEGLRACQRIAYSHDWSKFEQAKPDPFNRNPKTSDDIVNARLIVPGWAAVLEEGPARAPQPFRRNYLRLVDGHVVPMNEDAGIPPGHVLNDGEYSLGPVMGWFRNSRSGEVTTFDRRHFDLRENPRWVPITRGEAIEFAPELFANLEIDDDDEIEDNEE